MLNRIFRSALTLLVFSCCLNSALFAGLKMLPLKTAKFGVTKTAKAGGTVTARTGKTATSAAAGTVTRQAVKTAIK